MAGATIDHMVSLTILIAALLIAMMTYNGMFASAIEYDNNRQVANKAVDLMNAICLSPGSPADWGETDSSVLGFGLQDPDAGGYTLSPHSIMRLNTTSNENPLIEYPKDSGVFYNNISTSYGHAILNPIGDCINYTSTSELLGVNGTYGFSVDITQTLDVTILQVNDDPLTLNVNVAGSGLPLSGATLNSYLFYLNKPVDTDFPLITSYSNVTQTGPSGSVDIEFDVSNEGEGCAYSFLVYVNLGGVNGVGYFTSNTISDDTQYIVPLVDGFDVDDDYMKIILTHSYNILPIENNAAAHYNASFFTLTSDFQLQQFDLENSTGLLNTGTKLYNTTRIPSSESGILVISYLANGRLGSVIVPWGIGALGVSASFGGSFGSSGYDFVATEIRQVTINGISYHVKVSTWKLRT
ncbi:MAG: hypothetical protein CW691_03305 [Candidatus Bathyarchaeum sp.]|nr:MAG: hypothetical protein CW691_03305 [Candidatus Bathyarchaeum sp.]